ncbi:MAG: hypothetical protein IJD80_03300, partial [Oscillospiraceae bacterium]|nr:hypothetical protein [Oscillospiraceae bacterium]
MKRIIGFVTAFMLLCPLTAFANSAPMAWDGITAYGIQVKEEKCPVVVEKEILTLEIDCLPDDWIDRNEVTDYTTRVTAQYTFYNPAGYDVNATLIFPFGSKADYTNASPLVYGYDILADGYPVGKQLRHTYSPGEFDINTETKKISDGYRKDSFFTPDKTVTKYVYRADGLKENQPADVGLVWNEDINERRLLFEYINSYRNLGDDVSAVYQVARKGRDVVFYVIGKPLESEPDMKCYVETENGGQENIEDAVLLAEKTEMTFEEFILNEWCADTRPGEINDVDWYNLYADSFERYNSNGVIDDMCRYDNLKEDILLWYCYDISVAAGERLVNTVTAPLYPSINLRMEPPVYEFEYLLSPAAQWAEFGDIEIYVNTPFYILESSVTGFEKTENGYVYKTDSLPEGELQLTV